MAEIKSRQERPAQGVEYSEIHISDEENLGTGVFAIALEPKAMLNVPIVSSIVNVPVFQMFVNINYSDDEVTVVLGRADNNPPLSREVFVLPKNLDVTRVYKFDVLFKDWKLEELKMNGAALEKASG
ncbi:MAG: hypothetical protein HZA14_11030 [Nitrospirae bacterium]|nr:hypothetical protein [Nitrospirota bacterium]